MTPAEPLQSANSVSFNDCNLRITNAQLLEKIHGHNPETSLSANDILTAHKRTVSNIDCWSKAPIMLQWTNTSFIQNLCTLAIAKLEGNAEQYGRPSFAIAKNLYQKLAEYGTNPDWSLPDIVKTEFFKALGKVQTQQPYNTPQKCGAIELWKEEWLATLYYTMTQAIYNITTDCGASIPFDPRRIQTRISMLANNGETPYVFGVQQWGSNIDREMEICNQRLKASFDALNTKAQNTATVAWSAYTLDTLIQWRKWIEEQEETQSQDIVWSTAAVQDTKKQTPDTPICA
jgi:hypothetical protein